MATKAAKQNKGKRAILIALAVVVIAILCTGAGYSAWAKGLGLANYSWFINYKASDTTEYVVSTPGEIYALADIVNGDAPDDVYESAGVEKNEDGTYSYSFKDKTIYVATGRNPSISTTPSAGPEAIFGKLQLNALGTHYEFSPIGTEAHPFEGTFDGGNAELADLLIDDDAPAAANPQNIGLFGVIGESGKVCNLTLTGNITLNTDQVVENLGGVAGMCYGTLENVTSKVEIAITSSYAPTLAEDKTITPVQYVGGVVGCAKQSISDCSYLDSNLTVKSASNAASSEDSHEATEAMVNALGGVAGVVGVEEGMTPGVSATNCINTSDIYICLVGTGAEDNWGEVIDPKSSNIGGVIGTTSANVYNCGNEGEVRTSPRYEDAKDNPSYSKKHDIVNDNGGSTVGGVVGNFRQYVGTGLEEDPIVLSNCYNTGTVIGLNNVGGIAGKAGVFTTITQCSNGNKFEENINADTDVDTADGQGYVLTTRWNKPFAGGITSMSLGTISYCYNRGDVNNTQSGYYMAGICGSLGVSDYTNFAISNPAYTAELYACYNTGTIGDGHNYKDRYGAIAGINDGYIHDCVARYGCVCVSTNVPTGLDSWYNLSNAIGADTWGNYSNLGTFTTDELRTSAPIAVLNATCPTDGGYAGDNIRYWFSGYGSSAGDLNGNTNYNDGYPVLTTWAEFVLTNDLEEARLSEVSVTDATYSRSGSEPSPSVELSYLTNSGVVTLVQNADYLIVPETDAFDVTITSTYESRPYKYSIKGIGKYKGYISDFGNYGINAGTFANATVLINSGEGESQKFNWNVQFPNSVKVVDTSGQEYDDNNDYTWVIYDSRTYNINSIGSTKMPVFDSAGYIVFEDNPDEYIEALKAVERVNNTDDTTAFTVYDRNKKIISDSTGMVYDSLGDPVSGKMLLRSDASVDGYNDTNGGVVGYSCTGYRSALSGQADNNNGSEGYVLEVIGKGQYEGSSVVGHYIIAPAYIDSDCDVSVEFDGTVYKYDSTYGEDGEWYTEEDGTKQYGIKTETFTGSHITPNISISYLGRELIRLEHNYISEHYTNAVSVDLAWDYTYGIGGDECLNYIDNYTPTYLRNRNCTIDTSYGARIDIGASYSAYNSYTNEIFNVRNFDGFVWFEYDIDKASSKDVAIDVSTSVGTPTTEGATIDSPVSASLNGVELVEDLDYSLTFYTVDEDDNISEEPIEGYPSQAGRYTVEIEMLPLNFKDSLADFDIDSFYFFDVSEGKQFEVDTFERTRENVWTGDPEVYEFIDDVQWDPSYVSPEIRFLKLDEEGNPITDEDGNQVYDDSLVWGRDYTYTIYAYEPSSSYYVKALNVEYAENTLEPLQSIEGLWLAYNNKWAFEPYYQSNGESFWVQIDGQGEYSGCTKLVRWLLKTIDLENPANASKIEISDNAKIVMYSKGTNAIPNVEYVKYDGSFIECGSVDLIDLYIEKIDDSPLAVGSQVKLTIQPINKICGPFSGKYVSDEIYTVQPGDVVDFLTSNHGKLNVDEFVYNGAPQDATITCYYTYEGMYEHFTTECFDNIDAGTALCLATGDYTASGGTKGTLSGHMSYYYTIQQRSLTSANSEGLSDFDIKIDGDDFAYTGEAITPSVTVVDNRLSEDADPARKNLQEGVDYYLTYAENTDPGTAVIYITGMGNYCDTIKLNFNIKEDANNVCYYVKFANALDSSVTVHSSIKIDGCSDGETVKVNVNDLISSQDCASDFDEFNQKYYLQDDQEKELTLDVHAKNVITFKFLPIGVTMPVVEDVQIEKVNKINDVYLKATVYPLSISQSVTWSSLDPEIAKIDPVTGKVEFIKDGVVEFVATSDYDGQSAATFMLSYSEENSILDPSTGISVTGLPDGINLEIETLDKSSDYYSRLSYYDKLFSLFNIKLYSVNSANEKVEVQPACPLKVSVPLTFDPTTLENDLLFIYHYYEGDSKYERLEYEVNETNNTLDFVLNSCSRIEIFGPIVEKATELPLDPSEDDGYQSWINGWLTGDTDSVAIYDVIDEAQDNNSKNLKVAVDADFEDESTVPEAEQNVLANEAITEESSVKNNRYDDDSAKQNLATTAEDLKSDSNNLKNLIPALLCISALLLGVLYVFANSKKKRRVEI